MGTKQYGFSTSRTLINIVVYFLLFLAGDLLNSVVFDSLFSVIKLPCSDFYVIPRMLGCLLLTYLFFWIYTTKVLHLQLKDFGITLKIRKWGALSAVLLPVFVIVIFLIIGTVTVTAAYSDIPLIVTTSIITALKAGILEEMLFRGFIMKLTESRWSKYTAILLPSFLFSLAHIPSMETFTISGVVLLIISGTLVGTMFSLVTYKGSSISNSVLVHSMWNFMIATNIFHITTAQRAYGKPIFSIILPSNQLLLTGGGFGVEASFVAIMGYLLVCGMVIFTTRRHITGTN